MNIIRGLHHIKPEHRHCVLTIGNFDGVHRGHLAILGRLTEDARDRRAKSMVITFEPHPQEYFHPQRTADRLTRFKEKMKRLKQTGIDYVLCLNFNARTATMTAHHFIQAILWEKLAIQEIIVGDDFRFGKAREGNLQDLQHAGRDYGFTVIDIGSLKTADRRISSTQIRDALRKSDFKQAADLLNRPYALSGRVVLGKQQARAFGFPTANIYLQKHAHLCQGVFVVEVSGIHQAPILGVANIGQRPTLHTAPYTWLEVHLFDFHESLYGQTIHVRPLHKLRDEQKFVTIAELKAQIAEDVRRAKAWCLRYKN